MKNNLLVLAAVAVCLTSACQQRADKKANDTTDSLGYVDTNKIAQERADTMNNSISNNAMKDDADFLTTAYNDGMFEIDAAKLAQKNAASAEVKELAKKIESDHAKANEQISMIASKNNITLPTALSEKKQSKYGDLAKVTGKEFDKEYIKEMVKCHDDAIDAFEKKSKNANNTEIQDFAVKTIPVLTAHKTQADVIKEKQIKCKKGKWLRPAKCWP